MMRLFVFIAFFLVSSSHALDGIYLGGQVGQLGLTGTLQTVSGNALGFGLDLGFKTGLLWDITFSSQMSSHTGGAQTLKLYSQTLAMNLHADLGEFDLSAGVGPGFYTFSRATSNTYFGLHLDAAGDVVLSDHLRTGLGFRYHALFGDVGADDFWSVMMRLGYLFDVG